MTDTTLYIVIGVLALPILLLTCIAFFTCFYNRYCTPHWTAFYRNAHIVITGGSDGLGASLALQCTALGATVTIISRNYDKLDRIVSQSILSSSSGRMFSIVADVTDRSGIAQALEQAENEHGPIDLLFPCAGASIPGKLCDRSLSDFQKEMELNYFGTLYTIYPLLAKMKNRQEGRICFITSALALTSYVGYDTYSPTKHAVKGLAETLRNEYLPYNVHVHIAFPANMDTTGYELEMMTKPSETVAIESSDILYDPSVVATSILRGVGRGEYNLYCGALDVNLLGILTAGCTPRSNMAFDMLMSPLAIIIARIVRWTWDHEVLKGKYHDTKTTTRTTSML